MHWQKENRQAVVKLIHLQVLKSLKKHPVNAVQRKKKTVVVKGTLYSCIIQIMHTTI